MSLSIRHWIAPALLALVASCNTVSIQTDQYVGVPTFAPTQPASVQILRAAPTRPNVRLGEIVAEPQGSPSVTEIESKLQESASKMGANAVVIVADRTELMGAYVSGPWYGRELSPVYGRVIVGVAIRYTN